MKIVQNHFAKLIAIIFVMVTVNDTYAGGSLPHTDWGHSDHANYSHVHNYVGPIVETGAPPRLGVVIWSKRENNLTLDPFDWKLTDDKETTHSWSVSGGLSLTLETGLLAKALADGKVSANIAGLKSGSVKRKHGIEIDTVISSCRWKKYLLVIDMYTSTKTQRVADTQYFCGEHALMYFWSTEVGTASGAGDTNEVGTLSGGALSQSTDICKNCYTAPPE